MNETISINCAEDVLKNAEANTVSVEKGNSYSGKSTLELLDMAAAIIDEICARSERKGGKHICDDCQLNFELFETCFSSLLSNIRCKLLEEHQ